MVAMVGERAGDWFRAEEQEDVRLFWAACASRYKVANAEVRRSLLSHKAIREVVPQASPTEDEGRDAQLFDAMDEGVRSGNFARLEAVLVAVGARWSRLGIDLTRWYEISDLFRQRMMPALFSHYRADAAQLE